MRQNAKHPSDETNIRTYRSGHTPQRQPVELSFQEMPEDRKRMIQHHPRTGEPHDLPDFHPIVPRVTMMRTFFAGRFIFPATACIETGEGILRQPPAVVAECRVPLLLPAIQGNHALHGGFLPFDPACHTRSFPIFPVRAGGMDRTPPQR